MKTKIFALMAAMMLLMGTTAMAQNDNTKTTETELKGDVNGDGIVDVADIAAVIAVMHEQGTVKQQYYWYVGQENPASIDTNNLKEASNEAGWHLIGTSIDGFTLTFNNQNLIEFDEKKPYYLIIPEGLTVYAAVGSAPVEDIYFLPTEQKITGYKTLLYHTSVWEVKGIVIK